MTLHHLPKRKRRGFRFYLEIIVWLAIIMVGALLISVLFLPLN